MSLRVCDQKHHVLFLGKCSNMKTGLESTWLTLYMVENESNLYDIGRGERLKRKSLGPRHHVTEPPPGIWSILELCRNSPTFVAHCAPAASGGSSGKLGLDVKQQWVWPRVAGEGCSPHKEG